MKRLTRIAALIIAVIMLCTVCGCDKSAGTAEEMLALNNSEQDNSALVGGWTSYGSVQLSVNEDGTGKFYGNDCTDIEFNGKYLYIQTVNGMSFSIQARLFGDDLVLFDEPVTYSHFSGIARRFDSGNWKSTNTQEEYTFEFADGKFLEDGKYSGTYAVDEDELVLIYDEYGDEFSAGDYCYCLYRIDDDTLSVYYSTPLRRADDASVQQAVSAADAA